ncbi:MAG: hypothetical protein H6608_05320 [Flavobacteriales bacterium]|nr:hypothetical protein [Bacteroidota bacterium]MCB9240525.1 hypothetical protein [Flavobacteriales bacterium]
MIQYTTLSDNWVKPVGIVLVVMLMILGCHSTEQPAIGASSFLIFGNTSNNELVDLKATPDGGFVVGMNTYLRGNQDFRVRKYTADFKLEWERVFGAIGNDFLNRIRVDADRIVVSGTSLGYGKDTLKREEFKELHLFYRAMDFSGSTRWETATPFLQEGVYLEHPESLISQSSDQLFLLREKDYSRFSGLVVLKDDGTMNKVMTSLQLDFAHVFETDAGYVVHWCTANDAGFSTISKSFKNKEVDQYTVGVTASDWPWKGLLLDEIGLVGQTKNTTATGDLQVNYLMPDRGYRYTYHPSTQTIDFSSLTLPFEEILSVSPQPDGHVIIAQKNGMIFETDGEFQVLHSFQSDASVYESTVVHHFVTKLASGEYIVGFEKDRIMHVVRYGTDGKVMTR